MHHHSLLRLLIATLIPAISTAQQTDTRLHGTWSSKSGTVLTGPDFYDPASELLKEPRLPGISFSFTPTGYFEQALYIVVSSPSHPACPTALLQWQHGSYILHANGNIELSPIAIDGRQILSDPCRFANSIYTRYNQSEIYKWYEIVSDQRRGKERINLYRHDGAPVNPMYLEYNPPQMLPTTTLHPSADSSSAAPRRVKREVAGEEVEEQGVDAGSVLIAGVAVSTLGVVLWGVVEAWWKRG